MAVFSKTRIMAIAGTIIVLTAVVGVSIYIAQERANTAAVLEQQQQEEQARRDAEAAARAESALKVEQEAEASRIAAETEAARAEAARIKAATVTRIEVEHAEVSGTVDDILSVDVAVYPATAKEFAVLEWSSSDPTMVDVDTETGEMACLSAGECTVKVIELGSGKEVTLKVIVKGKTVSGTEWYTAENADQFTQPKQEQQAQSGVTSKTASNGLPSGATQDDLSGYKPGDKVGDQEGIAPIIIGDPNDWDAGSVGDW